MKRFLILAIFVFLGAAGWSLGEKLSADALSMAIGIFFGVLASVPAALLVLAASRRADRQPQPDRRQGLPQAGYQTPVIVVAPPMAGYGPMPGQVGGQMPVNGYLPASQQIVEPAAQRQFRMVGEDDEWVDDF
ncbi:MAG: hypothetical protein KF893_07925 [Caldilineaceae bacterium]|nr:hypothetical protein [Caldilineaceae bacterium]